MSVHLVCEGAPDGLDFRVLNLLIVQKLKRDVLIEPAGGDGSLGSVADYLRKRYKARAYTVEDRNFCPRDIADQTWNQPDQKRWIWRRHEIENYLLEPRLIVEAFRSLQASRVRGADELPTDDRTVLAWLHQTARFMLESHAGWSTYWQLNLLKNKPDTDVRLLKPKDALPSDAPLPQNKTEWLDYLLKECLRLKQACQHLVEEKAFEEAAIVERYDAVLAQISAPDFLDSGCFLFDLEGKKMLSAMLERVNRAGVSRLSYSDWVSELVGALDRLYGPGFFEPDDFAQLADRLV